ncbi:MAG: SPOR domain-containing protein [Magnetococcales bacterium]|nr:SPOR domain-containing protein [Magnetococcales bacterium]MBF0148794.1 SPOR domain-containing protein [Magnetococcales bacterium]MBF0173394.1 SPOR domain-containing protein [Magnetococcales bacterium]MBF0346481.1 SPOR domain-containing protein [Magnetococcales bacterium]MBF0629871.1 SPOR domain-containing protein [Magnetococcales bacterium]
MATFSAIRPTDGLFSITLLELFAGLIFLGFILLSFFAMTQEPVPVRREVKYETEGVVVEGMVARLAEHLDNNLKQRDDQLGRMITDLGDKLDRIDERRELNWSRLRNEINERLKSSVQEAMRQGSERGNADPVQLAQAVSKEVPVVNDAEVTGSVDHMVAMAPVPQPIVPGMVEGAAAVLEATMTPPAASVTTAMTEREVVKDAGVVAPVVPEVGAREAVPVAAVVPATIPAAAVSVPVVVPLEEGVFDPAPAEGEKRGYYVSMGCFSQQGNALECGRKARPLAPRVYRKRYQNGSMSCVFSGPYQNKGDAQEVLQRLRVEAGISDLSVGSY